MTQIVTPKVVMLSMAAEKAQRLALAEQKRIRSIRRSHILPWSAWQGRLPSMQGLNREDVRVIASSAKGVFHHATSSTSYVSAAEIYRLRRQLRAQSALKKRLLPLRKELIQKTHGWLLDESGAVRMRNEPGAGILVEITRILTTLRVFKERSVNIDQALNVRQLR